MTKELVQLIPEDNCTGYEVNSPELSGDNSGNLPPGEGRVDPCVYKAMTRPPKCLKNFEVLEKTGTEISYRCMDCRNCAECKKGVLVEDISIREEYEQDLINKSVTVNIDDNVSSAYLPFTADPDVKLMTNGYTSLKYVL